MLKERFSRSSSRDGGNHQHAAAGNSAGATAITAASVGNAGNVDVLEMSTSANVTPEMVRRTRLHAPDDSDAIASLQRRTSTPEVVRIRTTTAASAASKQISSESEAGANGVTTASSSSRAEVIRHGSSIDSHEHNVSDGNKKGSKSTSAEIVRHQKEAVINSGASSSDAVAKRVSMAQNRQVRIRTYLLSYFTGFRGT